SGRGYPAARPVGQPTPGRPSERAVPDTGAGARQARATRRPRPRYGPARRGLIAGLLVSFAACAALAASPATGGAAQTTGCAPGQAPAFSGGFAALRARLGGDMGPPPSCEYPDPRSEERRVGRAGLG